MLSKVARALGVTPKWLREGEEHDLSKPLVLAENAEQFRAMEGVERYRAIPFMADPAGAGPGMVMEEDVAGFIVVHERAAPVPADLRGVRVQGDSMAPVLPSGTIVGIDMTRTDPSELSGRIVCCRLPDGEIVIKRLRLSDDSVILCSDNPDQDQYPPIAVPLEGDGSPIIGEVVWAWQDFR